MVFVRNSFAEDLHRELNVDNEPEQYLICRLLRRVADLNYISKIGESALHIVARRNFLNSARILLKAGAVVNIKDKRGSTPLHLCACNKNGTELMRELFKYGAEVDAVNTYEHTPLFEASYNQCHENIQELVKNGAAVNIITSFDNSPLLYALLGSGAEVGTIKALLKAGADINCVSTLDGHSALYRAVATNADPGIIKLLLANGAEPFVNKVTGCTPLHCAARRARMPQVEAVRELIKGGVPVDIMDKRGRSALYYAVFQLNVQVTHELLRQGAHFELVEFLELLEFKGSDEEVKMKIATICKDLIVYSLIHGIDSFPRIKEQLMHFKVDEYLLEYSSMECNLREFRDACVTEAERMQIYCDCGESSVWGCISGYQVCTCDINLVIFKLLVSGEQSNFTSALFYKLKKECLLDIVLKQVGFREFKNSGKHLILILDCVKLIERFVSFEDLMNYVQSEQAVMSCVEFDEFLKFI